MGNATPPDARRDRNVGRARVLATVLALRAQPKALGARRLSPHGMMVDMSHATASAKKAAKPEPGHAADRWGLKKEVRDLMVAVTGGAIVGMPLLYTMEMWLHGDRKSVV